MDKQSMDNSSTGLVTVARAGVKTGLVVYLARLEQQKLVKHNWSIFRAGHKKVTSPSTRVVHESPHPHLFPPKHYGFW